MPVGRPNWKPTDEQRRMVRSMAGYGVTEDDICNVLRISPKTLRRHCREELDNAFAEGRTQILQTLHNAALGWYIDENNVRRRAEPNITSAIFLAKTRCGLKERMVLEDDRRPPDITDASDKELEDRLAGLQRKRALADRKRTVDPDLPEGPAGLLH